MVFLNRGFKNLQWYGMTEAGGWSIRAPASSRIAESAAWKERGRKPMQKVVYISNSRDFTEQTDINENKYLVRINKLLEEGWTIAQMNTQTVAVDPKLENYLHKETLVSFVILEKNQ